LESCRTDLRSQKVIFRLLGKAIFKGGLRGNRKECQEMGSMALTRLGNALTVSWCPLRLPGGSRSTLEGANLYRI
jgi:hypothetical protein